MPTPKARVYAVDTIVPIEKTRSEIEKLLKSHGASRFFYGETPAGAVIGFYLEDLVIKMELPLPQHGRGIPEKKVEQAQKSAWRALLLVLKAKLEAIARKISTVEREFMPDVVLPDGKTVSQWMHPQLKVAFERGEMPKQLPFLGGADGDAR